MELSKEQKEIIQALKAEQMEVNRKTNVLDNKIAESEKKIEHLTKERKIWARICTATSILFSGGCLATWLIMNNNLQYVKTLVAVGIAECMVGAVATSSTLWKTLSANERKKQEETKLRELKYTKYLQELL